MKYSGLIPLSEKKSDYRQKTNTVHPRYIFWDWNKSREGFKASTTSVSGPSKTNYFCVICKKKIYLFYNWAKSYLVAIQSVSDSRSCSSLALQKSGSSFANALLDEYIHNLVKVKDKKTLIILQPYKGNICEVSIYI